MKKLIILTVSFLCVGVFYTSANSICTDPDAGTYKKYYPGDCSKYYVCENGQPHVESCGWLQQFDEDTKECVFSFWLYHVANCASADYPGTQPTDKPTDKPTVKPTEKPTTQPTEAPETKATTPTTTTPSNTETTTGKDSATSLDISLLLTAFCFLSLYLNRP